MEIIIMLLVGLPVVFWLLERGSYRDCNTCKTEVKRDAARCPACGANPKAPAPTR